MSKSSSKRAVRRFTTAVVLCEPQSSKQIKGRIEKVNRNWKTYDDEKKNGDNGNGNNAGDSNEDAIAID